MRARGAFGDRRGGASLRTPRAAATATRRARRASAICISISLLGSHTHAPEKRPYTARDVGSDARGRLRPPARTPRARPGPDSHTQYRTVLVTLSKLESVRHERATRVCRLRHTGHREVLPTATQCSVVRPLVQPLEALGHIAGRPAIQFDAPLWLQVWSGLVGCAVRHPQRVVLPVSQARKEQCTVGRRGRRL